VPKREVIEGALENYFEVVCFLTPKAR